MSNTAREIIEEALRLPLDERAAIVAELIASLDGEPDADAEQAWAAEIERRANRALRGESVGRDWSSVRSDLEARHRTK
jgi:putative addiction module component (TIGR02574 family)